MVNYAKNIDTNKIKKFSKNSKFLLQIGVFEEKKNALNLLIFLKSKIDDNLFIKNATILEDKIIYKVFAGPYREEKAAKLSAEKLLELGFNTIYKKE